MATEYGPDCVKTDGRQVRLTITPSGENCKVEVLNSDTGQWEDLSRYLCGITINARVGELTTITLDLIPTSMIVRIQGEPGQVRFYPWVDSVAKEKRNTGSETE